MKNTFVNIILVGALLGIGFLVGQSYVTPEVQTITKTDTVKVGYDSAYVSILKFMNDKTKKELRAERERNKKLAWRLRNVKPTVVVDTFTIHDTLFTIYSSAFRIGADTLFCVGDVHFDMKKFYFTDAKFTYPQRTIYQTKLITTPYCTLGKKAEWFTIGTAIGIVAAKIFIH